MTIMAKCVALHFTLHALYCLGIYNELNNFFVASISKSRKMILGWHVAGMGFIGNEQ